MKTTLLSTLLMLSIGSATNLSAQCIASFTTSVNGNTVTVTNTSTGGGPTSSFYWNWGDMTSPSTGANPAPHTYTNAGTYTICVSMMDSMQFCFDQYCDTVIITSSSSCNASFTTQVNGNTVTVTNTSTGTTPNTFYTWIWGDNSTPSYQQNPGTHTYANSGTYVICLSIFDTASNCQDVYCDSVVVVTQSSCNASFVAQMVGNVVYVTNTSTGTTSTTFYTWSWGDNSSPSYQQNPGSHTYANAGSYVICLSIFDTATNCQDAFCDTVVITAVADITVPENSLNVYPNPASTSTTISFTAETGTEVYISVLDVTGKEIAVLMNNSTNKGTHSVEWNTSDIADGMYFVRLQSGQSVYTRRVVVQSAK